MLLREQNLDIFGHNNNIYVYTCPTEISHIIVWMTHHHSANLKLKEKKSDSLDNIMCV